MKQIAAVILLLLSFIVFFSCGKDENPFDKIDRSTDIPTGNAGFDSSSITGLHQLFLKDKCAIPSCHGGTFEPDFRTPQSSYSTLVWQPVVKNTEDYRFRYRVLPGDVAMSWLHERCISDDPILGRMPRYADPLSEKELGYLKKWIEKGAPDIDGKVAVKPDLNAQCWGYDVWANDIKLSDNRLDWASPFFAPLNTDCWFISYVYDDDNDQKDLKEVKFKISADPNDFSNAKIFDCSYNLTEYFWYAKINTADFTPGIRYYIRCTGQDLTHSTVSEQPNANTPNYTIRHFSFIVQ
jgi:hypothetical protein